MSLSTACQNKKRFSLKMNLLNKQNSVAHYKVFSLKQAFLNIHTYVLV